MKKFVVKVLAILAAVVVTSGCNVVNGFGDRFKIEDSPLFVINKEAYDIEVLVLNQTFPVKAKDQTQVVVEVPIEKNPIGVTQPSLIEKTKLATVNIRYAATKEVPAVSTTCRLGAKVTPLLTIATVSGRLSLVCDDQNSQRRTTP